MARRLGSPFTVQQAGGPVRPGLVDQERWRHYPEHLRPDYDALAARGRKVLQTGDLRHDSAPVRGWAWGRLWGGDLSAPPLEGPVTALVYGLGDVEAWEYNRPTSVEIPTGPVLLGLLHFVVDRHWPFGPRRVTIGRGNTFWSKLLLEVSEHPFTDGREPVLSSSAPTPQAEIPVPELCAWHRSAPVLSKDCWRPLPEVPDDPFNRVYENWHIAWDAEEEHLRAAVRAIAQRRLREPPRCTVDRGPVFLTSCIVTEPDGPFFAPAAFCSGCYMVWHRYQLAVERAGAAAAPR